MKNKILLFLFTLIVIAGITGCNNDINDVKQVSDDKIVVEVGQEIKKHELLSNSKFKVIDDDYIDTSTLGEKEISIDYYEDGKSKSKSKNIVYEVKDTTPPVVMLNSTYSIKKGYDKELAKAIFCADNYDRSPNCEIDGEYNLDEIGEYNVKYVATDSSNNKTEVEFVLKVIEDTNNTNNSVTNFKDIYDKYKNTNNEIGIDVSKWQGKIDFNKVKAAGASFVMIRLGYQNGFGGSLNLDPYYEVNIKNAKSAGLKVGVYFFSYAVTTGEAEEQANYIINNLKGIDLDLPIAFDWENWSKFNTINMNLIELNNVASAFMKKIDDSKYQYMIYGSKNYLDKVWSSNNKKTTWLAHYISKTTYDNPYLIWQLCSNGKIDGINGYVDIDILYNVN